MMAPDSSYMPVLRDDIVLGKPLPWAVFDRQRKLVLAPGSVVTGPSQLDALLLQGLCRERPPTMAAADSRRERRETGAAASEAAGERAVPLDDIKLGIGDPFQIQTQGERAEARYYVKLIGYLKGKSVLVTLPEVDGRLCLVREGQAFVVRFFAGQSAYAFTASVLRSSSIPFPHMHLSYPAQVRGLVVRTGERVAVRIICAIVMREDTRTVNAAGVLTNLSVSGALLSAKQPLGKTGELLSIKFRVDIREIAFFAAVDATIRSVSRDDSGEFLHGVQFAGLPNEVAIAMTAFVYQKLAETSR
ncbi:flagellar brake protein [Candidatus Accumulibacter sp. ACC003]|uniref:flagellar brake protein n=1 Tax=Candidatus Accumulibacter sp. ACC003 TaxID=2823334 RepID=UPI0025C0C377|nr:flagellar brake protein [Candidatus Accumulibacter sp. ACC003]